MAKEYIERDFLIKRLEVSPLFSNFATGGIFIKEGVIDLIEKQPAADVVEVRHGYWVDKPTGRYCYIASWCSVCNQKSGIGGIESNRHKPYCPNCGAKMDGEREER